MDVGSIRCSRGPRALPDSCSSTGSSGSAVSLGSLPCLRRGGGVLSGGPRACVPREGCRRPGRLSGRPSSGPRERGGPRAPEVPRRARVDPAWEHDTEVEFLELGRSEKSWWMQRAETMGGASRSLPMEANWVPVSEGAA
ncbi:unnamed protein product [Prorocentrum cordatum]|uniref:Uncharacterized protein n=1 Tax=Prorocentrum cordatum TaxID=2364126 RepID=A0ABN9Y9T1_9DINO|nr:unnamed protein product [Polarella glacialis]